MKEGVDVEKFRNDEGVMSVMSCAGMTSQNARITRMFPGWMRLRQNHRCYLLLVKKNRESVCVQKLRPLKTVIPENFGGFIPHNSCKKYDILVVPLPIYSYVTAVPPAHSCQIR